MLPVNRYAFLPPPARAIIDAALKKSGFVAPAQLTAAGGDASVVRHGPSVGSDVAITFASPGQAAAPLLASAPRARDGAKAAAAADGPPADASGHGTMKGGTLTIGDVVLEVSAPALPELVPRPLFFDIPAHTAHLRAMAGDLGSALPPQPLACTCFVAKALDPPHCHPLQLAASATCC